MKKILPLILIFSGVFLVLFSIGPVLYSEVSYAFMKVKNQKYTLSTNNAQSQQPPVSLFKSLLTSTPLVIDPVNKDFSIVIERIGVNAPIVADVPVYDEKLYNDALKDGIAHASSSPYPSNEPGNVYLFAHSSVNFWRLGKYAQVFNLLNKLEKGDRVVVFYQNQQFNYEVIGSEIYKGFNTFPLTRTTLEPILTLQTCDPPGTTINRLVVTAKLVEVL